VETATITNSIVQAIPTSAPGLLTTASIKDSAGLAAQLRNGADPLSLYLAGQLTAATRKLLQAYKVGSTPSAKLLSALVTDLNALLARPQLIYNPAQFSVPGLNPSLAQMAAQNVPGGRLALNRKLLAAAFPSDLADLTLSFTNGLVNLSRCTVLGPAYLHRLEASECILDDVVLVENSQDGCVRFTAWATGSVIPRQYESLQIAPASALFNSTAFGQPAYAQLRDGVDNAVLSPAGATISEGAQDGSEMGAFAGDKNPIKERSILLKYQEYMPLGLNPILIHVT